MTTFCFIAQRTNGEIIEDQMSRPNLFDFLQVMQYLKFKLTYLSIR